METQHPIEETFYDPEQLKRITYGFIHVTSKACQDCPLFYHHPIVTPQRTAMIKEALHYHHHLECVKATIAERLGHYPPEFTICFSFFYLYAHRNRYITRAIEEQRIQYIDVTTWPGMAETGFSIDTDTTCFDFSYHPHRRLSYSHALPPQKEGERQSDDE